MSSSAIKVTTVYPYLDTDEFEKVEEAEWNYNSLEEFIEDYYKPSPYNSNGLMKFPCPKDTVISCKPLDIIGHGVTITFDELVSRLEETFTRNCVSEALACCPKHYCAGTGLPEMLKKQFYKAKNNPEDTTQGEKALLKLSAAIPNMNDVCDDEEYCAFWNSKKWYSIAKPYFDAIFKIRNALPSFGNVCAAVLEDFNEQVPDWRDFKREFAVTLRLTNDASEENGYKEYIKIRCSHFDEDLDEECRTCKRRGYCWPNETDKSNIYISNGMIKNGVESAGAFESCCSTVAEVLEELAYHVCFRYGLMSVIENNDNFNEQLTNKIIECFEKIDSELDEEGDTGLPENVFLYNCSDGKLINKS